MSTLRVNNITDTSGGSSSLSVPGAAKAWVNFDGTGTVSIRASLNVSSITDNGTGLYTLNFGSAFSDINYATVTGGWNNFNSNGGWTSETAGNQGAYGTFKTTTSVRIVNYNSTGTEQDNAGIYVAIFR